MADEPSVKGTLFDLAVDDLRRLIDAGRERPAPDLLVLRGERAD